jgi:hypothetical protein
MSESSNGLAAPSILLAVSVMFLLLGLGLCGAFGGGGNYGSNAGPGLICFLGGALGLLVGFIWLVVALILGANRR